MTTSPDPSVVRLYRPTGPTELALVEALGWLAWPPRLPRQQVGGRDVLELWVPAEELEEFNAHFVGGIRRIARYDTVRD
jgi:hypothetical protein